MYFLVQVLTAEGRPPPCSKGKQKRVYLLVRAVRVDALATVQAGILDALLDVLGAGRTLESLRADALEVAARDGASAAVAARRRGAQVLLVAVFAWKERRGKR